MLVFKKYGIKETICKSLVLEKWSIFLNLLYWIQKHAPHVSVYEQSECKSWWIEMRVRQRYWICVKNVGSLSWLEIPEIKAEIISRHIYLWNLNQLRVDFGIIFNPRRNYISPINIETHDDISKLKKLRRNMTFNQTYIRRRWVMHLYRYLDQSV